MNKHLFLAISIFVGLGIMTASVVYGWTNPTAAPPGANPPAPINVGPATQTKTGGLNIQGNVGIGTTAPGARLTVQTPDAYGGHTIRFESRAEPAAYWLNLNTVVTPGVVRWVFDQQNAGTNFPNILVFDRGNVGIGTTAPAARLQVATPGGGNLFVSDYGCGAFGGIGGHSTLTGCANYALLTAGADTFINRPSGNAIRFREANADQVIITSGGNVGIGTTVPGTRLDVRGNLRINTDGGFWATTGNPLFFGVDVSPTNVGAIVPYGDGGGRYGLHFQGFSGTALFNVMTVAGIGNVGIGTTAPGARLDVVGGEAHIRGSQLRVIDAEPGSGNLRIGAAWGFPGLYVDTAGRDMVLGTPNAAIRFRPGGADRVFFAPDGNVGIGTTAPTQRLHVAGWIRFGDAVLAHAHASGCPAGTGVMVVRRFVPTTCTGATSPEGCPGSSCTTASGWWGAWAGHPSCTFGDGWWQCGGLPETCWCDTRANRTCWAHVDQVVCMGN